MEIKNKIAKRFLLPNAVQHYLVRAITYSFLSLDDDNELYPLSEVILLQKEKVLEIEREYKQCPTEFLLGQLLKAKQTLNKLEKRLSEVEKK